LRTRGFSDRVMTGEEESQQKYAFAALARDAGAMLAPPDGPRIAALKIGGWDTHSAQVNRLIGPLKQLDAGPDEATLDGVFPGSAGVGAMPGLIRA
jgi:uncharacterized protein (DUF1501 family)